MHFFASLPALFADFLWAHFANTIRYAAAFSYSSFVRDMCPSPRLKKTKSSARQQRDRENELSELRRAIKTYSSRNRQILNFVLSVGLKFKQ